MRIKILGCGESVGVPSITGVWGNCNPHNPKNRRKRSSIAVEKEGTSLIIDTTPDLREQCLLNGITHVDAVLYTHDHADHTHGIDDLRPFYRRQKLPIPLYGDKETIRTLYERFEYIFNKGESSPDIYRAFASPRVIDGTFKVGAIEVEPFVQGHGYSTSLGYRLGKAAYSTDVVELNEEAFKVLEGIDVWIVDCLSLDPRPTHSHLAKTLEWIKRVKPRKAYLTHMSLLLDYDELLKLLPPGVEPAYDGLVIDL